MLASLARPIARLAVHLWRIIYRRQYSSVCYLSHFHHYLHCGLLFRLPSRRCFSWLPLLLLLLLVCHHQCEIEASDVIKLQIVIIVCPPQPSRASFTLSTRSASAVLPPQLPLRLPSAASSAPKVIQVSGFQSGMKTKDIVDSGGRITRSQVKVIDSVVKSSPTDGEATTSRNYDSYSEIPNKYNSYQEWYEATHPVQVLHPVETSRQDMHSKEWSLFKELEHELKNSTSHQNMVSKDCSLFALLGEHDLEDELEAQFVTSKVLAAILGKGCPYDTNYSSQNYDRKRASSS